MCDIISLYSANDGIIVPERVGNMNCREKRNSDYQIFVIPSQNECFRGKLESACLCVRPSVCVFICVQNTNFCESAGGGIKSQLVTALGFSTIFSNAYTKIVNNVDSVVKFLFPTYHVNMNIYIMPSVLSQC